MPSLNWARSLSLLLRLVEVDKEAATKEPTEESTVFAHFERLLNKLLNVEVCVKRLSTEVTVCVKQDCHLAKDEVVE